MARPTRFHFWELIVGPFGRVPVQSSPLARSNPIPKKAAFQTAMKGASY